MIQIKKSIVADSKTASKTRMVAFKDLKDTTNAHIEDVQKGLAFFEEALKAAGENHDNTKLLKFEDFHHALISGNIKDSSWYEVHITKERHHLLSKVPKDVNLIDVIEHLVDCVMAGMTRSGKIYDIDLPDELLQTAHKNTVELLKKNIEVLSE